jgi:hypothetical protein
MRGRAWQWDGYEENVAAQEGTTLVEYGTIRIYKRTSKKGERPAVIAWRGKAKKPFANYWFPNETARTAWIAETKASEDARANFQRERKQTDTERLGEMRAHCKVGALFYTSWGYDQTNVEWFEVVGLKGKTMVLLREIAGTLECGEDAGPMSGHTRPCPGQFLETGSVFAGKVLTKRIQAHSLKIDDSRRAYPCGPDCRKYVSWYA